MPGFKFGARSVFLTYTHTGDISAEDFYILLAIHLAQKDVQIIEYVVGKEEHEDGDFHHHAYLVFERKLETRDERFFDIDGFRHPNIAPVKNTALDRQRVQEYCRKGGSFVEDLRPTRSSGVARSQEAWAEALEAPTKEEFFERVRAGAPKEWVLWNDRIVAFADQHYERGPEFVPEFNRDDFVIPPELQEWWFENIQVCTPPAPQGGFFL